MRDFSKAKRIVVKIGTNTLTRDGHVDRDYVDTISDQICDLRQNGMQFVLVTSGAIGMGASQLALSENPSDIKLRQACAAVGQPQLMAEYKRAFARFEITVGQVLLTAEVLDHRKTYLNLRNAIEALLHLNVIPVLNENDCVSTDEIRSAFGDNDKLSALVASKIDADLLILLSDIDALYNRDPRQDPTAQPIETVTKVTESIIENAGSKGSRFSTGGMKTKIEAAKITSHAGCRMVLANGRTGNVIKRILAGETIGTLFIPKQRMSNRSRWILHSHPAGVIHVDEGALEAIKKRKSLLPSGIVSIEGSFEAGAVVLINSKAKAVTGLGSVQLKTLIGKHSTEIKRLYGPDQRDVVAIPEDIVWLES